MGEEWADLLKLIHFNSTPRVFITVVQEELVLCPKLILTHLSSTQRAYTIPNQMPEQAKLLAAILLRIISKTNIHRTCILSTMDQEEWVDLSKLTHLSSTLRVYTIPNQMPEQAKQPAATQQRTISKTNIHRTCTLSTMDQEEW